MTDPVVLTATVTFAVLTISGLLRLLKHWWFRPAPPRLDRDAVTRLSRYADRDDPTVAWDLQHDYERGEP